MEMIKISTFNWERKPALRNNLDKIMKERHLSNSYLSKLSGVSRSTIYRIRINPYNKTTMVVKNKLCSALHLKMNEFDKKVDHLYMILEKINKASFSKKNIIEFQKILFTNTHGYFQMDPYNENSCLNIRMKWKRKNKFSGNIRITTEEDEIVFKVIDFDFTFFESKLVDSIIRSFEIYAFYIGVKYIIFSPGVLYNTYELVHEPIRALIEKDYVYYRGSLKNAVLITEDNIYSRFINKVDRIYGFAKFITY